MKADCAGGEIRLMVFGQPAPQGSKKHVGKGIMAETSRHLPRWRRAVAVAGRALVASLGPEYRPADYPVRVSLVFTLARPQRPKFSDYPGVPPDLDKLARGVLDALTGVLWRDDARIVGFDRLDKVYVGSDDPMALVAPGCSIVVRRPC